MINIAESTCRLQQRIGAAIFEDHAHQRVAGALGPHDEQEADLVRISVRIIISTSTSTRSLPHT